MLANKSSQISRIGQIVIDAIGGPSTGKILFAGKILEVTRTVYKGHTIGEVTIAAIEGDEDEDDDPEHPKEKFEGLLKIVSLAQTIQITQRSSRHAPLLFSQPFKNENLICRHESPSGETTIVATVPDLICVLDAQNGQALGTPVRLSTASSRRHNAHHVVRLLQARTTSTAPESSSWASRLPLSGQRPPEDSNWVRLGRLGTTSPTALWESMFSLSRSLRSTVERRAAEQGVEVHPSQPRQRLEVAGFEDCR